MARKKPEEQEPEDFLEAMPASMVDGDEDLPPAPARVIEAFLFVGSSPLTVAKACEIMRGVTQQEVLDILAGLNKKYRLQNRPYRIFPKPDGYTLGVLPKYHYLLDRLNGTDKEAKLSPQALDTLALIAYRQPISRQEIDSLRGGDTSGIIRQLARLGLVAMQERTGEGRELHYGTTKRFLELFHLRNLDDLPRHQDLSEL